MQDAVVRLTLHATTLRLWFIFHPCRVVPTLLYKSE